MGRQPLLVRMLLSVTYYWDKLQSFFMMSGGNVISISHKLPVHRSTNTELCINAAWLGMSLTNHSSIQNIGFSHN